MPLSVKMTLCLRQLNTETVWELSIAIVMRYLLQVENVKAIIPRSDLAKSSLQISGSCTPFEVALVLQIHT